MSDEKPVQLVTTKPDVEVAADLKVRLERAMEPVLGLFDEAAAHGLLIQWDTLGVAPPFYKHKIVGLRVVKHF